MSSVWHKLQQQSKRARTKRLQKTIPDKIESMRKLILRSESLYKEEKQDILKEEGLEGFFGIYGKLLCEGCQKRCKNKMKFERKLDRVGMHIEAIRESERVIGEKMENYGEMIRVLESEPNRDSRIEEASRFFERRNSEMSFQLKELEGEINRLEEKYKSIEEVSEMDLDYNSVFSLSSNKNDNKRHGRIFPS